MDANRINAAVDAVITAAETELLRELEGFEDPRERLVLLHLTLTELNALIERVNKKNFEK
ncbi:MAG: hypothetical protein IJY04_03135 [Clostridia bacterium]|nr:hypothetical protein [Clostridia bacterium]